MSAPISFGQISVANSTSDFGSAYTAFIPGFDLKGGDTLVVMVAGEISVKSGRASFSVSFNGTPLRETVFQEEGQQGAGIYHVTNPRASKGNIEVTFGSESAVYSIAVLSLNNVGGLGRSDAFGEPSTPQTLRYIGSAGGFVVAAFADNTYTGGDPLTISGGNINTYLEQVAGNATDSAGRALAYGYIDTDGLATETFTAGKGTSERNVGVLATFVSGTVSNPAPAPSNLDAEPENLG